MGGNALNFQTRRVESSAEFRTLVNEVLHILTRELSWRAVPVRWYHTKESFGDMDILVDSDIIDPNWVDVVLEKFQPKDHFKNGSCLSFDYKDVQVDLILAPAKEFEFSYYYFAWNDLGNFVGRTAHRLGFKFGHDGLWYVLRDPKDLQSSHQRDSSTLKTLLRLLTFWVIAVSRLSVDLIHPKTSIDLSQHHRILTLGSFC